MQKCSSRWIGCVGVMPVVGWVCCFLSACGGSNDAVPKVDLDPRVSSAVAISKMAQLAEGSPPDHPEDLKGPDSNNNGIRDDIDAYIATRDYGPKQRKAVQQYARGLQKDILSDTTNRDAAMARALEGVRAIKCLGDLDPPQSSGFSYETVQTYSKLTSNTPGRARAHRALDHALSGRGWEFPQGDTCEN